MTQGVVYRDPITGSENTVFPASGSTENYPPGYFDDRPCAETIHLYPQERQLKYWQHCQEMSCSALMQNRSNTLIQADLQEARAKIAALKSV